MATKTKTKPKKKTVSDEGEDDVYSRTKRQIDAARGGADFYKIQAERTVLRLFPYKTEDGETMIFQAQRTHWLKRPEDLRVPCPGRGCAICALKDDLDEGSFGEVRASTQYLANAVVREGGENKQVVVRLPKTVADDMTDLMEPRLKVCDLKLGRDFIVRRKKHGKGPIKYTTHLDENGAKGIGLDVKPADLSRFKQVPPDNAELDTIAAKVQKAYER